MYIFVLCRVIHRKCFVFYIILMMIILYKILRICTITQHNTVLCIHFAGWEYVKELQHPFYVKWTMFSKNKKWKWKWMLFVWRVGKYCLYWMIFYWSFRPKYKLDSRGWSWYRQKLTQVLRLFWVSVSKIWISKKTAENRNLLRL
jgi:hypothetical protein